DTTDHHPLPHPASPVTMNSLKKRKPLTCVRGCRTCTVTIVGGGLSCRQVRRGLDLDASPSIRVPLAGSSGARVLWRVRCARRLPRGPSLGGARHQAGLHKPRVAAFDAHDHLYVADLTDRIQV